ncbi:MAG: hypothetical protein UT33_C0001G0007 [Candidatus Peregrinibacteria bacterium GW2011_GWC2_39_14]|nr:MAG: hypothetical protein UT33_C0001G0007 [Candidatus Peregrinibacteria bacterium GW2011_GWC2_39_14]
MNFLIIGASSGLGRALAEELAANGHNLLIVASDERDLQALCSDLSLRGTGIIDSFSCHISFGDLWLDQLKKKISIWGELDGIFLPVGWSSDEDYICSTSEIINKIVEINFTAVVKIISYCLPIFLAKNKGYIVGFGSVSSLRGRSFNVVYAAAKRALTSYFESLRHALAATDINVQIYQLGYLNTSNNWGRKLPFPKADPVRVAQNIIKNLNGNFGSIFFPRFWSGLQYIVRWLPWVIFKRLKF